MALGRDLNAEPAREPGPQFGPQTLPTDASGAPSVAEGWPVQGFADVFGMFALDLLHRAKNDPSRVFEAEGREAVEMVIDLSPAPDRDGELLPRQQPNFVSSCASDAAVVATMNSSNAG
ncbi:MAG: hypothetical protein J2P16_00340 [Mycobacterium sp.]|nr:hypothetical protein [Mycobacterium sp.]